jgi:hypothetical protein
VTVDDRRKTVAVHPPEGLATRPRLFEALEAAFPVVFRPSAPGVSADGTIVFCDGSRFPDTEELAHRHGAPVLAVGGQLGLAGGAAKVQFGDQPPLDRRLRRIALSDRLVGATLRPARGEAVLAGARSGPAWTWSSSHTVHRVRSVLPELAPGEVLYALLSQRPVAALAVVQFLREIAGDAAWLVPALRAVIVFDDPNLRWKSYGFLDYRALVRHADEHSYHAAMAMIPIDAGRPHPAAVDLFSRRPDRLSLVFHGNDHIKHELLAPADAESALATAAQAVRRVARFERASGLHVERVMMPPHGLCSEQMTRALSAVGFDALAAIHPRPWTQDWRSGPLLTGWRPADFVGGCAVLPRIPLTSSAADIALRAFLDHPVIVYGHHEDVAGGLEPLAEAAALINRLGDVGWMSPGRIAAGNYERRVDGDALVVRPHSRRIVLDPPPEARSLELVSPEDALGDSEVRGWSVTEGPVHSFGEAVELPAGAGPLEVRLHSAADVDVRHVPAPAWRPWPRLRRATTEARDRATALAARA